LLLSQRQLVHNIISQPPCQQLFLFILLICCLHSSSTTCPNCYVLLDNEIEYIITYDICQH